MAEDSHDLVIRVYNLTCSDLKAEVQFHLPF
ncbi:glycosyl hydrolase-related protein [Candidatus Hakubella thermalkaliphila]